MADAVTGLLGAVLMIVFLVLIASKLNEVALWITCISGLVLMLWAFWEDDFRPLFDRRPD